MKYSGVGESESTGFKPRRRKVVRRTIACIAVGLLAACGQPSRESATSATADTATPPSHEEPILNFANFIEEIAPGTLPAFTRETGIAVNYDTYELNQVLESRLLVGSTGLDLVVPTNNYLERQIASGVYHKLDKSLLPNLKNVDPEILKLLERNDSGNQYAVPYVWGTHAFGYDVAKVEAALGGPAPDSWALVFDPKYAAKLAKCGIIVVDAPWVMVSHALNYLGRDPNSERPEDLAAAMQVLMAIRPYVREITGSTMTRQLVEGEACLAVGLNADFFWRANSRGTAAETPVFATSFRRKARCSGSTCSRSRRMRRTPRTPTG